MDDLVTHAFRANVRRELKLILSYVAVREVDLAMENLFADEKIGVTMEELGALLHTTPLRAENISAELCDRGFLDGWINSGDTVSYCIAKDFRDKVVGIEHQQKVAH